MTTIVMNTLKAAVTHYDWSFQSITPTRAADGANLYALGGDTDAGAPIDAEVRTGRTAVGSRSAVEEVYYGMAGAGTARCVVEGISGVFSYPFPVRAQGGSRGVPGKGVRESYLAFGFGNTAGADFRLDVIAPVIVKSNTRRIG